MVDTKFVAVFVKYGFIEERNPMQYKTKPGSDMKLFNQFSRERKSSERLDA